MAAVDALVVQGHGRTEVIVSSRKDGGVFVRVVEGGRTCEAELSEPDAEDLHAAIRECIDAD